MLSKTKTLFSKIADNIRKYNSVLFPIIIIILVVIVGKSAVVIFEKTNSFIDDSEGIGELISNNNKNSNNAQVNNYSFVHEMTNTVINASDGEKWGNEKITLKKINDMIEKFTGVDDAVVIYLEEWKNGDFSNSVIFHNFVWKRLGGTIGKAESLNTEEIDKVIERIES